MAESRSIDLEIEGLEDPVEIGVGGFATVYKAYQPAFRRTVAVKVLATLNLDDAARERFERECQAMGSLSEHPNIVTVYGAGFTANGRPYLVMAFLPGGALQDRIDREGTISWQDATTYGVHLAGALETAHRAQIVHRDIKPGNVLMSTYGDAQLTDFGIARISGGHETRSGVITASMAHAPPEVLDGNKPTVTADVYSLGSTIYELMSGRPAFESAEDESMVPMLRRILTEPPPDLRLRGIPDPVCQVIERSMLKDPAQRQQTAVQFGREIQAARRALGIDPGKLTVPSDVSLDVAEGEEISFVSAPFTGQFTGQFDQQVAAAGHVTGPVSTTGQYPTGQEPTTTGQYPAYAGAPAAAPTKKKSKGLLIGIVGLVVLALIAVAGIAVATQSSTTASSTTVAPVTTGPTVGPTTTAAGVTTTAEAPTTTEDTIAGYTPESEQQFVDACVKNGNTRLFCRCVFKEIKDTIPFQEYLEIESLVSSGGNIETTKVAPIVVECTRRNPANISSSRYRATDSAGHAAGG